MIQKKLRRALLKQGKNGDLVSHFKAREMKFRFRLSEMAFWCPYVHGLVRNAHPLKSAVASNK